jgi:hypothetical protein
LEVAAVKDYDMKLIRKSMAAQFCIVLASSCQRADENRSISDAVV